MAYVRLRYPNFTMEALEKSKISLLREVARTFYHYALAQEFPSVGVQGPGVWDPRFSSCISW